MKASYKGRDKIIVEEIWHEAQYDEVIVMAECAGCDWHNVMEGIAITSNLEAFTNAWNGS